MENNSKIKKLTQEEMSRLSPENAQTAPVHPVYLLLQNVRSLWNVGAMFRTADAARIQEIIITGYTATPPRKEIDKTALGATDFVKWSYEESAVTAIEKLKAKSITIAALEIATPSLSYSSIPKNKFPICIVVGNEVSGIDQEVLDVCDMALEIPQYGVKHSLNVAVATGIALYEAVRLWKNFS